MNEHFSAVRTLLQQAETMQAHGLTYDARARLRAAIQHLEKIIADDCVVNDVNTAEEVDS